MSASLPPDTERLPADLPSSGELISAREAAKLLGISLQTLRRWEKQGVITSERPDGKMRQYKKADIEAFRDTRPLTIAEAATFLGISVSTLRRLEKRGTLIPDRLPAGRQAQPGDRRYSQDVLRAYRDGKPLPLQAPSVPVRGTTLPFIEEDDELPIPIRSERKNSGSTQSRAVQQQFPQTLPSVPGMSRQQPHLKKPREIVPAAAPRVSYQSPTPTGKHVVTTNRASGTAGLAVAALPAIPAGERVRQSRARTLRWQAAVTLLGMPILSTRLSTVTSFVVGFFALSAVLLLGLRHFFGRKQAAAALKELYLPSAGTAFAGSAATGTTGEVLLPYRTYTLLRRRLFGSLISSAVVALATVVGLRTLPVPAYFVLGPLLLWFVAAGLYSLISLLRLTPSGQRLSTLAALFTTDPRQIFARYAKTGEGGALQVGYTSYKRTYRMATTAMVLTVMLAGGALLLALLQARSTADDNIGAALTQFGRVTDTLRTGQGNLREELQKLAAQSLQPAPTVDEDTLFDRLVARVLEQLPAPPEQIVREETEIRVIERTEIQPGTIEAIEIARGSKFVVKDYTGTTFVTFDSTRTLTLEDAGIFNIEGTWHIEGAEVTASATELNRTTKLDDTGAGSEGARQIGTRADNFTNFSPTRNDVEAALAAIDTAFGSGAVGADTLDFAEFEDTLDLDADLAINSSAFDVVFNEDGGDSDFRIEGDTNANLFYVDASTDRVGIGTATPERTLHVVGAGILSERASSSPQLVLRRTGDTTQDWQFTIASSGNFGLADASGTAATPLSIEPDAAGTPLYIKSSGNVGIGTSGADRALDVLASAAPQLRLTHTDGSVYAEAQADSSGNLAFTTTGTTVTFTSDDVTVGGDNLNVNGLTYTWPASHTTDGVLSNNGSGTLTWATLGAAAVTPDSLDFSEFQDTLDLDANLAVNTTGFDVVWNEDGGDSDFRIEGDTDANLFFADASTDRIGIGVAAPLNKLHVQKDSVTVYVAGTAGTYNNIALLHNGSSGTGTTALLQFYTAAAGSNSSFGIVQNASGFNDFIFNSYNGAFGERMRITADGLVGILDASPDASLEVVNDGSGDSFLVADTNDGDTTPFVISSAGNVGIGTTAPNSTLDVTASTGGALATRPMIQFTDTVGDGGSRRWAIGNSLDASYGDLNFLVSSAHNTNPTLAKMTLSRDGNVGIGDTTPDALFDIDSAATTTTVSGLTATALTTGKGLDLASTSTAITSGELLTVGLTASGSLSAKSGTLASIAGSRTNTATAGTVADDYDLLSLTRTNVQNGAGGTLTAAGSVLRLENVATQTAGTLTDTARVLEIVQDADSSGNALGIAHAGSGDAVFIGDDGTLTDSTPFVIDSTGEVGIGTASPSYPLHVARSSGSDWAAKITNTAGAGSSYGLVIEAGTGSTDTSFLVRNSTGTDMVIVRGNGNVGIGTTAPDSLLEVSGDTNPIVKVTDANNAVETIVQASGSVSGGIVGTLTNHPLFLRTNNTDALTLSTAGNATVAGDLTISGDDLVMATNTSGFILVADGTNYNPVAVSGDATLSSSGVFTIDADEIDFDQMEDTMDLDANLAINTTGFDVVWNEDGGDSDFRIEGDTDANLFFADASTDRIGIGTASPETLLHLHDPTGASVDPALIIGGTLNAVNAGHSIDFRHTSTTASYARIAGVTDSGGTTGELSLWTSTGLGTAATEKVRITGAGLVGIMDTTPDASLEVVNDGSGDSFLVADTNDGDTTPFVIDSTGDVGIGLAGPTSQLAVFSAAAANTGISIINTNASGTANLTFDYTGGGSVSSNTLGRIWTSANANDLLIGTAQTGGSSADIIFKSSTTAGGYETEIVRLTRGGLVGINDASPDATFDIDSTATTGNALGLTATSLTTGKALSYMATNTPTGGGSIEPVVFALTNAATTSAATYIGAQIQFTNNPAVAGNADTVLALKNMATSNTTDNVTSALLLLDNADTSTTGSTVVLDALSITNSGNIAGGITNAINIDDTDVTNDIVLQNDEVIHNNTDGTIAFTDGTNTLFSIVDAGTTGNATVSGDLTISGDDLFMATNTSGFILVADGTNYNPVAMSGDITIDSTGATAIGSDKVTEADLKAVDAAGDEECLTFESTVGDFEWQSCSSGSMTSFTLAGDTGTSQTISDGNTLTIATGAGLTATAGATDTVTLSVDDDGLDFAQFQDTLDLDAALTLNQGTNAWTQSFTGTTTDGFTYSATSLTSGTGLDVNVTNTHTTDAAIEQVQFDLTNAQSTAANTNFAGFTINFTNNPSIAGNTENVFRIQNQATTNATDNAVAALLRLDNADTSATGSTVVTDAIRITNSGDIAGGITNAINIDDTDITTDIVLQNDETIHNDTNGTITLGGDVAIGPSGAAGGALEVEVGASGNKIGYLLDYDDTAGTDAMQIDSESTDSNALQITHQGDTANTAAALHVTAESGAGAAYFYSNVGAGMDDALVEIVQDHASGDQAALFVQQDGTAAGIEISPAATGLLINADSLSTGVGINLDDAYAITSGSGIKIYGGVSGTSNALTGDLITASLDKTVSSAVTVNETGNYLDLNRLYTTNHASATVNITGALASFSSNCTQTLGTCTDSSNIISATQSYASATGAVVFINNDATAAIALNIDSESTSENAIQITHQGDTANTAAALHVTAESGAGAAFFYSNVGAGMDDSLVEIHQDHTSGDQAALTVNQDGSGDILELFRSDTGEAFTVTSDGSVVADSNATTGTAFTFHATDVTGGTGLALNGTSVTFGTLMSISGDATVDGKALSVTWTGADTAGNTSTPILFSLTNSQATTAGTFIGTAINFTNTPTVAGNTEHVLRVQNQATTNTTDNAVAALLLLDNADTSASGSTLVTDAIRITNSGNIAGGVSTAINIADTDITTDIVLQGGETIDNDNNAVISFKDDASNLLATVTDNGTVGYISTGHLVLNGSGSGYVQLLNGEMLRNDSADVVRFTDGSNDLLSITDAGTTGNATVTGTLTADVSAQVGADPLCWDGAGSSQIGDCTSLQQYKNNATRLSFGLDTLMQLTPREFDWIDAMGGKHDLGFIAEEVAAVEPLLATYRNGELKGVKYHHMPSLLTQAIQEQQGQLLTLGQLIGADIVGLSITAPGELPTSLLSRVNQLEGRVAGIESGRSLLEAAIAAVPAAETPAVPTLPTNVLTDAVFSNDLVFSGALTAENMVTITGTLMVKADLSVLGTLMADTIEVAQSLTVHGDTTIFGKLTAESDVAVKGTLSLSEQQGGYATVRQYSRTVTVPFSKAFVAPPLVTANALSGFVEHRIADISPTSFTIELAEPAESDLTFSWVALAVTNPTTTIGEEGVPPEPPAEAIEAVPVEGALPVEATPPAEPAVPTEDLSPAPVPLPGEEEVVPPPAEPEGNTIALPEPEPNFSEG